MRNLFAILALVPLVVLAGCSVMAEVLYGDALLYARERCNRLISMQERQFCLERLNTAQRQADDVRKK
jgi:hypothetical protein